MEKKEEKTSTGIKNIFSFLKDEVPDTTAEGASSPQESRPVIVGLVIERRCRERATWINKENNKPGKNIRGPKQHQIRESKLIKYKGQGAVTIDMYTKSKNAYQNTKE